MQSRSWDGVDWLQRLAWSRSWRGVGVGVEWELTWSGRWRGMNLWLGQR